MKGERYQKRFYREWVTAKGLHQQRVVERETDVQVLTDKRLDVDYLRERIRAYRWDIERYIMKDKRFLTSLKPIPVELDAEPIIKRMSEAARQANVGPMATVAGAVAEFLGKDLLRRGYKDVAVENGGDIFIKLRRTCTVEIYSGKAKRWNKLKLKIRPKNMPVGICTSSGTVGHSLSFGAADSVVMLSKNTALADAAATATCNRIQSRKDLENGLQFARSIKGISGVVIIFKSNLVSWGAVEFI